MNRDICRAVRLLHRDTVLGDTRRCGLFFPHLSILWSSFLIHKRNICENNLIQFVTERLLPHKSSVHSKSPRDGSKSHHLHCRSQNKNVSEENGTPQEKTGRFIRGRNYCIRLRRRQNANKGRDCEEHYGAIKSRLRSIRVQKLEFARDPPWMCPIARDVSRIYGPMNIFMRVQY